MKKFFVKFVISIVLVAGVGLLLPSMVSAESEMSKGGNKVEKMLAQIAELQEKVARLKSRQSEKEVDLRLIRLINHIAAHFPEQGVFVESTATTTQVVRLESKDINDMTLAKTVFAASTTVAHDPMKLGSNPLGPYDKGLSLGFTLGRWLDGKGNLVYKVKDDNADLKIKLEKLIPNSVYTVWCSRMTLPPNASIVDKPCGKEDGSENSLKTDAYGNAEFNLKMKPLEPSTSSVKSVIALAYHSDGKTYGSNPGEFGLNSHVHVFATLPMPEELIGTPARDLQCMQEAIVKRDNAMIAVVETYYTAVKSLLNTRRDALKAAWSVNDDRERRSALKKAWDTFNDGRKEAVKQLKEARKKNWRQYRDDRKSCGFKGGDPFDGEGHDERL